MHMTTSNEPSTFKNSFAFGMKQTNKISSNRTGHVGSRDGGGGPDFAATANLGNMLIIYDLL